MKLTWKIWLLIIFILVSFILIFVTPQGITFLQKGVLVKSVEKNSSIFEQGLRPGMIIKQINTQEIKTTEDYSEAMQIFSSLGENETKRLEITTDFIVITNLFSKEITNQIVVTEIPKTRIKTGLDIQGGARALVTAEDQKLTDEQVTDLIDVSQQRLNIYGLSDVKLRKVSDLSGNNYMLVEIAGSSPSDLEELIAKQGKFEAKIGNDTVFTGGNQDITYVGRTGQDALITECFAVEEGEACNFKFLIFLSEQAAQRHADITDKLELDDSGKYLSQKIDFYLDGIATDSLNIGADLRGKVATQIQISGSGSGPTRQDALNDAKAEMKKLQTVLITGSLPFKLQIVKTDRISSFLGEGFTNKILIAAIVAILSVAILLFIRYRNFKISLALLGASFSEIIIILGIASLIGWNLDLPSIAGMIAVIGTGVDSLIVIIDESKFTEESIKQRIKKALFIIMTAYITTFVALVPLYWAGAGLLKGFAVTTLIGISAGVFITRPAFADIIRQMAD